MRVLLISPCDSFVSYGLRMVSACLKQTGHDSTLLFVPADERGVRCYESRTIDIVAEMATNKDMIGISLFSNYYLVVKDLCQQLKRRLNIPIAIGGVHALVSPSDCLSFADYVFRGESEVAFSDFVTALDSDTPQSAFEANNLAFCYRGQPKTNQVRIPCDLDQLPFPDYDENHNFVSGFRIHKLSRNLLNHHLRCTYVAFPTRGCPFNCSYCCNNSYREQYRGQPVFRKRSVANVIRELVWYKSMGAQAIMFDDDAFIFVGDQYLEEFVVSYQQQVNLPISITGINPRVASTVERKLDILRPLNLTFMRMGLQSGSEKTRRSLYLRRDTNEDIMTVAKALSKRKISLTLDVILENPFESTDDLMQTSKLLASLPPGNYWVQSFALAFYPGTLLHQQAIEKGLISGDWERDLRSKYGYYGDIPDTAINKLIVRSHLLSPAAVDRLWTLRSRNTQAFTRAVNLLCWYSKVHGYAQKAKRVLAIYKSEGGRRIVTRATFAVQDGVARWLSERPRSWLGA
jgi:anaerobic magnesium-protoporphyrin IX monomethyl ester cyclase